MAENKLEYFRTKIIDFLSSQLENEKRELKKSLRETEALCKSTLPIGYVSTYKDGSQWRKVDSNKWKCIRQASTYTTESKGAKIALKALIRKVEKATSTDELLDVVMFNIDRFRDEKGRILPFVENLKTEVDIKKVSMTTEKKNAYNNLISIVNKENVKKVKGKTREQIFNEYDNTLKIIAIIPKKYVDYIGAKSNNLLCGEAYMLDHIEHHHPTTPLALYRRIQYILEQAKDFYIDEKTGGFILTENYGKKKEKQKRNILIFAKDKNDNIILHKTFYDSTSKIPTKYKKINLADNQQGFKSEEDEHPSIGRSKENSLAPASGSVISGRPDNSSITDDGKKSRVISRFSESEIKGIEAYEKDKNEINTLLDEYERIDNKLKSTEKTKIKDWLHPTKNELEYIDKRKKLQSKRSELKVKISHLTSKMMEQSKELPKDYDTSLTADNLIITKSHGGFIMNKTAITWEKIEKSRILQDIEYFKNKVLEHLKQLEAEDTKELKKSLLVMEKAGFPIGTIREWKGKKYIKIAPNKWRPKYDSETRGAKMSIKDLMRKVDACTDSEELLKLILEHKARFSDDMGRPLPFVKELSDYVSKRNDDIESLKQTKSNDEKIDVSKLADLTEKKLSNDTMTSIKYKTEEQAKAVTKELKARGYRVTRYNKEVDIDKKTNKKNVKKDGVENDKPKSKTAKLRDELLNNLKSSFGSIIKNVKSGIEARLSKKSADKMGSEKAIEKSKTNGFSVEQHFEVANDIVNLYKKADLIATRSDRKNDVNIASIKRFNAETKLKNGEKVNAYITVKESIEHGHKIYSVELTEINKAPNKIGALGDATASSESVAPKHTYVSDSSIPQTDIKSIRKNYESSKSVIGNKKTITLPNGEKMKCHYKLVEANTPVASHNEETFSSTQGFPKTKDGKNINDRDYKNDKDAQESVRKIADNFNSLALDSPPIVTKDGIVISGNNRTMSSKLAAKNGTDKAYLDSLKDTIDEFGIDEEELENFKNPRIILEVDTEHEGDYTTQEFAQFNQDTKKTMNNVEKAVKLTKTLDSNKIQSIAESLTDYETMSELYSDFKGCQNFVHKLVENGIIGDNEKAQFLTSDGMLNDTGKDFVETVLVGSVLSEDNIRRLDGAGGKRIRQKLVRAILPLIENKGTGKEYSFNKELNQAVDIAVTVAKKHDTYGSVKSYLLQTDLFNNEKVDSTTEKLAELIHDESEKDFSKRMKSLGAGLRSSANGEQDIFLGGVESKESLMTRFLEIKKSVADVLKSFFSRKQKTRPVKEEDSIKKAVADILQSIA